MAATEESPHRVFTRRSCAAALPDNGVANRLAGAPVPHNGGLALVGDADRIYLIGRNAAGNHRLYHDAELRRCYFARIVLDPSRLRIYLAKRMLRRAVDATLLIENKRPRRRCALVERQDVFLLHDDSPSVRIWPSHPACTLHTAAIKELPFDYTRVQTHAYATKLDERPAEKARAGAGKPDTASLNMTYARLRNKSDRRGYGVGFVDEKNRAFCACKDSLKTRSNIRAGNDHQASFWQDAFYTKNSSVQSRHLGLSRAWRA